MMKPPDFQYNMILINKEGKQVQFPFYTINKEFYERLKDHIILGVLKVNIKTKEIESIENTPQLNPNSGYYANDILKTGEKIWRYLELYKFEDLIQSSSLYHSRIDTFKDNLEGVSP
jgi:hypothetical protein